MEKKPMVSTRFTDSLLGPKTKVFFGIKKFFRLERYPEPPKGVFLNIFFQLVMFQSRKDYITRNIILKQISKSKFQEKKW